jgi:predicted DNA binding protein
MKRLVIEVPYERFWTRFFGRHSDRVKVVEALRCFKCDSDGFALICRIRLRDRTVTLANLTKDGPIQSIETLYEDKDGSHVVFISGRYPEGGTSRRTAASNVFQAEPPEFIDVNRMKVALVGDERELQRFLHEAERHELAVKVLSLLPLGPRNDSAMSFLTAKQKQVLVTAYGLGYYDVPRKISSEEMARLLKIDKSTLAEHLRKAEGRMIKSIIAG